MILQLAAFMDGDVPRREVLGFVRQIRFPGTEQWIIVFVIERQFLMNQKGTNIKAIRNPHGIGRIDNARKGVMSS